MFKRFLATAAALTAASIASAQGIASVDLLEPAETSGTIPSEVRIVDIYFDVASTDTWTAAGLRALTETGAAIIYFDANSVTPGIQPGLFSGGTDNRFTTMLSKPRNRDAADRFENGGAIAVSGYDPQGGPITSPSFLNVSYFANPPESRLSPSVDGYIARIAVDISNVPPISGADIDDYNNWGAGPIASIPPNSSVVLRSAGFNEPGGTATVTFDVPAPAFSNWAMWYVPEPMMHGLLALGGLAAIRRR